jgi:hypothetical protein
LNDLFAGTGFCSIISEGCHSFQIADCRDVFEQLFESSLAHEAFASYSIGCRSGAGEKNAGWFKHQKQM